MSDILLYMHGGSGNKGCEAIVRSTVGILNREQKNNITLASWNSNEDIKCGLDKICTVFQAADISSPKSIKRYVLAAYYRIFRNLKLKYKLEYYPFSKLKKNRYDIALSIGGDNYCYPGGAMLDKQHHDAIINNTGKTFLWGCSIEKEYLTDKVTESLSTYNKILARESITYNNLVEAGLKNVVLYPDPAFTLQIEKCELPSGFEIGNTIGINLSPYAFSGDKELAQTNYINLIKWILSDTDMKIALIPHVNKGGNSDDNCLKQIKKSFDNEERVIVVADQTNCMRTKYIISQCRLFVGARTHSTIAAYSTKVPTMVLGYSVKALGIAKDIFGDDENYIISVKDFKHENEVLDKFKLLFTNEAGVREHLDKFMDNYIEKAYQAGGEVLK